MADGVSPTLRIPLAPEATEVPWHEEPQRGGAEEEEDVDEEQAARPRRRREAL